VELDWIETFLAVVDRGGFTAASSQVHRSQSRVSAHIASLERELGVQLIDRARRPATLTPSGRIFAEHAREIIATVGSARSSIEVLRAINTESLAVLTTPSLGAAWFPGITAHVLDRHPQARVLLSEHSWPETDPRRIDGGFVLAVLPTKRRPHPAGLREQVLWREPIKAVLPADHPMARSAGPSGRAIAAEWLVGQPLVVGGASASTETEIVAMMAHRGFDITPRVTVDSVQAVVALVRGGVGIGIAAAVALENADITGVAVLELDDKDLILELAVYWYDVLLATEVGRTLHTAVLAAPLPKGAIGLGRSGEVSPDRPSRS
jgi:DNA-binding transcriptional LysR family regulator